MASAIMIRAKFRGVEYYLSMTAWAEKISMAPSYFRRLKKEAESEGLKDQELLDHILAASGKREKRSSSVISDTNARQKENRLLSKNSQSWYLFNFGRASLI